MHRWACAAALFLLKGLGITPGANMKARRLCLTPNSLVEWSAALPSEVLELRQLSEVAALVRFAHDPRLLGIEWLDAALPPSQYVTMERDALVAALLAAVQVRAWAVGPALLVPRQRAGGALPKSQLCSCVLQRAASYATMIWCHTDKASHPPSITKSCMGTFPRFETRQFMPSPPLHLPPAKPRLPAGDLCPSSVD